MNIDWFYCFLEASRQKSFSKASEKLNITQPALSKQIRNLEDHLGVEIFKRSALGVELTEEGALLKERISPILSEIESLKKDLLNHNKLSSIRIGALPSLAAYYLPDKLVQMRQNGIRTELKVMSTSAELIQLISIGSCDVCIVQKTTMIPSAYWSMDLFREPFYAVFPNSHRLHHYELVTLEDLKDEPLVVYPSQCDIRNSIMEAYKENGMEPKLSVEVNFGESIPGFVAAGSGITILPQIIAKKLRDLPLIAIPIAGISQDRTVCMVCRKPSLGKKLVRYFSNLNF